MLVVDDISELFSLDLKDKFGACVLDSIYMLNHTIQAKNNEENIKLNQIIILTLVFYYST